jgi:hypothetical protein
MALANDGPANDGPANDGLVISSNLRLQSWRFVERILDIHHELQLEFPFVLSPDSVAPVGIEEMAHRAERFFCLRQEFANENNPINVDVGYHYTKPENLSSIVRFGLLGRTELARSDIAPKLTGTNCGTGVYVAKDPISFCDGYGSLCIMTARGLWGNRVHLEEALLDFEKTNADTVLIRHNDVREFVVLKRSSQCLPIFALQVSMMNDDAALVRRIIFCYHEKVQALLDELLDQKPTELPMKAFGTMISKERLVEESKARRNWVGTICR